MSLSCIFLNIEYNINSFYKGILNHFKNSLINLYIVSVTPLILNSTISILTLISGNMTFCDNFYFETSQKIAFFGFIY